MKASDREKQYRTDRLNIAANDYDVNVRRTSVEMFKTAQQRSCFLQEQEKHAAVKEQPVFYLRKPECEVVIPEIKKTDGSVIPERQCKLEDRAIYKHPELNRFYRGVFTGLNGKYHGMKIYTTTSLREARELQNTMKEYCGETFIIFDTKNNRYM